MKPYFQCSACDAIFDDPISKELPYKDEAWDHVTTCYETVLFCPDCGADEIDEIDEEIAENLR